MAYQLIYLDPGLSLYSTGRKPAFPGANLFQSLSLFFSFRSLARRRLDIYSLGIVPRNDVNRRSRVLEGMAKSSSESYQRGHYFLPGHDQLGHFSRAVPRADWIL